MKKILGALLVLLVFSVAQGKTEPIMVKVFAEDGYLNEYYIIKGDPAIGERLYSLILAQKKITEVKKQKHTKTKRKATQGEIIIVSIDSKVTEKNSVWSKYAWKLTLRNNTKTRKSVTAKIEWSDGEGYIVEDDIAYDLQIASGTEETFTGYDLIDASVADSIRKVGAKINWK